MIMKKLLTGCMVALAILAALTGLAGCDQDKEEALRAFALYAKN